MSNYLISTKQLMETTGYEHKGDVERILRDSGIRFFQGKFGPWTTIDLINAAGGLEKLNSNETHIRSII